MIRSSRRLLSTSSSTIRLFINGQEHRVPISATSVVQPSTTLLEYLRKHAHLTGTKLTCGEGGCGACSVTVSVRTPSTGTGTSTVQHKALNACLVPLASCHDTHVTTVELLGSARDQALHPVQEALVASFGSQCGFCTPGFVMSLYTAAALQGERDAHRLLKCIDGNLCRCTGYRPIADAVRAIAALPAPLPDRTTPALAAWLQSPAPGAPLTLHGSGCEWYAPRTLVQLLARKSLVPTAKLVAGNSEIGIEQRFKSARYPLLIDASHVAELLELRADGGALHIGAGVDLTTLWRFLERTAAGRPAHERAAIKAITDQLHWFSGTSIRSGATLGGNIATASPISDLNPVWIALDATFVLRSVGGERRVRATDFFVGYRQTALRPDEIIVAVHVPLGTPHTHVRAFKQSQRRDDDIAIVTACLAVDVDASSGAVLRSRFAFGGMAARTVRAAAAERACVGRVFDAHTFELARAALAHELRLPADVPGGRPEYRLALAQSMLYKFHLHCAGAARVPAAERSALEPLDDAFPRGRQVFEQRAAADRPVGDSARHSSGERQVTGEALYTDDLPRLPNELAGVLVSSPHAVGTLAALEFSDALRMPGVRGVYGAADVPGQRLIGDIVVDEPVFVGVGERVAFVGQAVAIVVADTEEQARAAARVVRAQYSGTADARPLISIEEAVAANSLFALDHTVARGDVDGAMARAPHRVSGRVRIGGQEHFYFEPNVTLAQPSDGGEMLIFASTQNINKTQEGVAHVLGVPMNKVTAQVRRIGGGFGGKETSNIILSCAAAVAAHRARRPVRLLLQRDEDMIMTGKRHPFDATYAVGFDGDGRVLALDVSLVNNGGYSFDLSGPVVDRAIMHSDNAYYLSDVRVRGRIAKTNLPTNTAFRGFGGPQGMLVAEHWIEHIALALGIAPETVRERNLYASPGGPAGAGAGAERRTTHFGQVVDSDLPALWCECARVAELDATRAHVRQYNAAHRWRKRGLAMVPSKFGLSFTFPTLNQGAAVVHIYTDGSVLVNHGGVEMGQGLHTKVLQIAAHALRVPLASVHLQDTSSAKIPNASPTAASVGSDLYGMATLAACEQLNARLAPYRARLGAAATMQQLAHAAWLDRVSLSAQGFYKTPVSGYNFETGQGTPFNYFTSGAAASLVELDTLTGDWRALRTDIVMDVGSSINPAIDIGQIEGAFVQGQGWLTTEDYLFGGAEHQWLPPGRLFAPGPGTYKIPALDDVPRELNVHLMKGVANSRAVYSSRGVGEPPILLSASIPFALRDAVHSARLERGIKGVERRMVGDLPLTSERLRMACVDQFSTNDLQFKAKGNF
jgi:xanthine dehydrogenase/oxidase